MCIGYHSQLVVFHILDEEFVNIFHGDVMFCFWPRLSQISLSGDIRCRGITHGLLVEIFGDQILKIRLITRNPTWAHIMV